MGNKCPKCGCDRLHYGDENFDWEAKTLTYYWSCTSCDFDFSDVWDMTFKRCEDDDGDVIDATYNYKMKEIEDSKRLAEGIEIATSDMVNLK